VTLDLATRFRLAGLDLYFACTFELAKHIRRADLNLKLARDLVRVYFCLTKRSQPINLYFALNYDHYFNHLYTLTSP